MSRLFSSARRRSATRPCRRAWARFAGARGGAAAVEFAFIAPLMVVLTIGLLEFGLILFDFQRASEATRRALRLALINPPLSSLEALPDATVECTGGAGAVACTGGGRADADADATFDAMVATMREVLPAIAAENVVVTYGDGGLDESATPGIVTPLVTVSLRDLRHPFIVLGAIPGLPEAFTFPAFTSAALGPSQSL